MKLLHTSFMKTQPFVEYGFLFLIFCFLSIHVQTVQACHQIQLAQKNLKSSQLVQQCYFPIEIKIHTKSN